MQYIFLNMPTNIIHHYNKMKPINPNFWTRLSGELAYRNLEIEEAEWNHAIFQSWR